MPTPEPNPAPENPPAPEQLQFRRAQHSVDPNAKICIACKNPIAGQYFHANGNVVCAGCTQRIESKQQAPPHASLLKAAIYGGGAALAGCAIYTIVGILGVEIGIVAILVGWMVGKAIRHASSGLGGRPQQILAVVLTYFAITFSYVAIWIYDAAKIQRTNSAASRVVAPVTSPIKATLLIVGVAAAAPFIALFAGRSPAALISLFIIFIGLRQAWVLTRRTEIIITGPY
ncbi:MAG TPA: hypothetical protein VKS01_10260 [Bryobacteraceae bacterium]|nr:hypothetical protein [Bryobacteraceae bacterium]